MPPKSLTWKVLTQAVTLACAVLSSACGTSGGTLPPTADGSIDLPDGAAGDGGGDPAGDAAAPDAVEVDADPPDAAEPVVLSVCAGGGADYDGLQAAIEGAPAGATLLVCAGTYHEHLLIDAKQLTIRGVDGAGATFIDGGGTATTVLVRDTAGSGVWLEGLTIRAGATDTSGGGLRCRDSVLAVHDSAVTGNQARDLGGGMYTSGCTVDVVGTLFQGNSASQGGGVYLDGGAATLRQAQIRQNHARTRGGGICVAVDALIEDSTIADNVSDWVGGGLYAFGGEPVLRTSLVRGNTSVNDGGGMYLRMGSPQIIGNTIEQNHCGDDGGGIRLFTASGMVRDNLVRDNIADDSGGGIRVSHWPSTFIDNLVRDNQAGLGAGMDMDNDASRVFGGEITGNHASNGGGINLGLAPYSGALIEGVLFSGNVAYRGAAIRLAQNYQPVTLRKLRIIGNHAGKGGALHVQSTNFTLTNSVIAGNDADLGAAIHAPRDSVWTDPCPCPPTSTSGVVQFVVFYANEADDAGAVLWKDSPHPLRIEDSILLANTGPTTVTVLAAEPTESDPAPPLVPPIWRYNDLTPDGGFEGMGDPTGSNGNLASDPKFVDAGGGNFHLMAGSPAIDAADPSLKDPDSSRADMGRFGGPQP